MQQPDGMRVHYLCHLIIQLAWERFVVDQKDKAGITNKVYCWYLCVCVCMCVRACVVCVCVCFSLCVHFLHHNYLLLLQVCLMYLDYTRFLNNPEASHIPSREFWADCASSHVLDGSLVSSMTCIIDSVRVCVCVRACMLCMALIHSSNIIYNDIPLQSIDVPVWPKSVAYHVSQCQHPHM